MPATSESLITGRKTASTRPTATSGTRYQNDGASESAYASITPDLNGSGSCWTAAGVRLASDPAPPPGAPAKTPCRLSVSRVVKIVVNRAEPTAAPISRKKLFALVAVPSSCGSTAFCTASTTVCITRPMPAPRVKIMAPNSHMDMSPDRVVSHTMASPTTTSPTTG